MINWRVKRDLLAGCDPLKLKAELEELQSSRAWLFIKTTLENEIKAKKSKVFNTIEEDRQMLDHNRNVITIKTLACVLELVQVARETCDEDLKKGEGYVSG